MDATRIDSTTCESMKFNDGRPSYVEGVAVPLAAFRSGSPDVLDGVGWRPLDLDGRGHAVVRMSGDGSGPTMVSIPPTVGFAAEPDGATWTLTAWSPSGRWKTVAQLRRGDSRAVVATVLAALVGG